MNPVFSFNNYVIKPQGLSIGGKYRVYDAQNNPVLHVEHKTKWSKPFSTFHIYADEKKQQELLMIQDAETEALSDYLAVTDMVNGEKIGGINADWKNWFEDAWSIVNVQGETIGLLREKSTGRAILHELTDGVLPQIVYIMLNEQPVAELRQKSVMIGHHLLVDFSMDTAFTLDRRLGLAAAIVVASHQGATDSV
jgi:hypothetical protein